jgi:DNA sulfur modification protein DndD
LERLIREEDHYLEGRRTAGLASDKARLEQERSRLREDQEEAQGHLVQALIPAAPLLVNPGLVQTMVKELEDIVHSEAGSQAQALQAVLQDLPTNLFDKPPPSNPPLTTGQVRFYKRRLKDWLTAYIPSPDDFLDGPLRLDASHARELLSLFQHYAQANQERQDRAAELRSITQAKRKLKEVQEKLDDISVLSPEEQQEFHQRKAANDERKQGVGSIDTELQQNHKQQQDVLKENEVKQKAIRDQQRQVRLSEQVQRKMQRAVEVQDFFVAYKEALQQTKREDLENALNQHIEQLMTSHTLLDHIRVDDHFGLHFLDPRGKSVAMGSLSAGMKQLVATALLWALKEVSGKTVPLIIDTPLARIDRVHQQNLLTRYYPNAGEQVIILLPTDSELDREKYQVLLPHIYKEYRLENPDGENTHAVAVAMYEVESEVAHG